MSKRLFVDNIKHQLYGISPGTPIDKPTIQQDTSKEDFLFCPSCETYLGVIESYFAEYLHKLLLNNRGPIYFDSAEVGNGIICLTTKKWRLLLYSS